MSTLLVSDLHLGARSEADLLRRPALREELLRAVEAADELVLLGDALEFRQGPAWDAMEAARPVFEELGEAVGDRRITIVPGNHDHELIAPWLRTRLRADGAAPLGLEERVAPAAASGLASALARMLGPAELELAYPGVWIREDVFALHGQHLDRHLTIPSFEVLGLRVAERWGGRGTGDGAAAGYEAIFEPVYDRLFASAQTASDGRQATGSGSSQRAWQLLVGDGGRRPLHHRFLSDVAFPGAVGALNAIGLGEFSPELSGAALRRSALRAMAIAVERLGISAEHVIFGHTHRAGPLEHDDTSEWRTASGTRLHNAGCWVHDGLFLGDGGNRHPYWPGRALQVAPDGPPEQLSLLADRDAEEFRARPSRPRRA